MSYSETSKLIELDENNIILKIRSVVSNRIAECSNTVLVTQIQKTVQNSTVLEKRGSLHLTLQALSEESFFNEPKDQQKQVIFTVPRKSVYFQEYVFAGTENKLLTNSFVQKLPVAIADKRHYRKSISFCFKRKPWYIKLQDLIALKYGNFRSSFDFWHGIITMIENEHGAAITAYFLFLRWLLYMNVIIFLLYFCFLVMPQVLFTEKDTLNGTYMTLHFTQIANDVTIISINQSLKVHSSENTSKKHKSVALHSVSHLHLDHSGENITNTTSLDLIVKHCQELYSKKLATDISAGIFATLQSILQGTGVLEYTLLFIGRYSPFKVTPFGYIYNLSLAFLCLLPAMFLICFTMMVEYVSVGIREVFLARSQHTNYYSNEVFSAWDYGINERLGSEQQHYRYILEMKTNLEEDRSRRESASRSFIIWIKLYTLRFLINTFVISWLCSCCYLIYLVAAFQVKKMYRHQLRVAGFRTFFIQYLPSFTLVILNCVSPIIFKILVTYEKYSPQTAVNISLFRNVILYLASIIILLNTIYNEISCKPKDICGSGLSKDCHSPRCWETFVGQQIFKLAIADLFSYFTVFLSDLMQYFFTHHFDHPLTRIWGHPFFSLPTEVLAPIYSQTILWLGVFYSPLLPALMIGKLVIVFYIKKTKILCLCDPTECYYRASRFNSVFMTILLVSFFFVMFVQNYMIEWMPPSRGCGPFHFLNSIMEAIPGKLRYYVSYFTSYWSITFAIIMLCLALSYYSRILACQKELVKRLKGHLVLESYDKQFLLKSIAELTNKKTTMKEVKSL